MSETELKSRLRSSDVAASANMHEFAGLEMRRIFAGGKRQNLSLQEDREFVALFLEQAATGGVLVVGHAKVALDKRLGREVALASAYNLLHRHNWRKLAPDKDHPQSALLAQEEWKRTPRNARDYPSGPGARPSHQVDVPGRGAFRAHPGRAPVLGS